MTAEYIQYLPNTTKTEYLCYNQNLHQKTYKVFKKILKTTTE